MSAIEFLNANTGLLNLVFALVVALATVFYAILTQRLVDETRIMREAQTLPAVAIRVEPHEEFLHAAMLIIENVGAGPAYQVKLDLKPDFQLRPGTMLSAAGLFKHGLNYLGPKQRITTFLASMIDQTAEIEKPDGHFRFEVAATYNDMFGKSHRESFPIEFLQFLG